MNRLRARALNGQDFDADNDAENDVETTPRFQSIDEKMTPAAYSSIERERKTDRKTDRESEASDGRDKAGAIVLWVLNEHEGELKETIIDGCVARCLMARNGTASSRKLITEIVNALTSPLAPWHVDGGDRIHKREISHTNGVAAPGEGN
tara:strand:- start:639 stop:1088 length:450 start_codon:yes stop_codon:yes gene_type:complete